MDDPNDPPTLNALGLRFESLRPDLLRVARRRLDNAADAEDVVQDAWLKLHDTDADSLECLQAWLSTVIARLCVDRLRHARVAGRYAASEPPDDDARAPSAESLLLATHRLHEALAEVLRRLSPLEATAWLLREALDTDYPLIARLIDGTPASCRQLVHRARVRLRAPAPRDLPTPPSDRVERCLRAIRSAEHRALVAIVLGSTGAADGRDRAPERIASLYRPGSGVVWVMLGNVVLTTLPVGAIAAADALDPQLDADFEVAVTA